MAISPRTSKCSSSASGRMFPGSSVGRKPCLLGSAPRLTSTRIGSKRPRREDSRSSRAAILCRSTECTTWKISTALRALFDCRGPMRCQVTWSATFEVDGLPASEAVALLEGALAANCQALKQFMAAGS